MVLNATSIGVRRRNRSFLCMCSRNCIFDIIIIIIVINIVFVVVVVTLLLVVVGMVGASPYAPGLSRKNSHDIINHGR